MALVALLLLSLFLSLAHCRPYPCAAFHHRILANHSYVDLSLVGDDSNHSDSVHCHTDLSTCCRRSQGTHRGVWYFPDGTRLPLSGGGGDIYEFRYYQRVDLRRRNNAHSPTGIYRCDIPTNAVHHPTDNSVRATVYVGLYTGSRSMFHIHVCICHDQAYLCVSS